MAERARRVAIGFQGGQAVTARISEEDLATLRSQLGQSGWLEIQSEDGPVQVNLGHVSYLQVDSEDHRVGFGL
jgi:hypothetical protein